eukprot:4610622-Amphidinium_carterae.1
MTSATAVVQTGTSLKKRTGKPLDDVVEAVFRLNLQRVSGHISNISKRVFPQSIQKNQGKQVVSKSNFHKPWQFRNFKSCPRTWTNTSAN